ncbi:hypothetical protein V500_10260, partial [Pseudogymnoascus sp. VKM F-4518 (FW-2643)]
MSLPAGGFITTRDGKRCTAVPKTTKSSSKTSIEAATTTKSSDDDNDGDISDDVATKTVDPAANVVLGNPTTIQDAPATTTLDAPVTTDPVVETPSDTVVLPTTTPVTEVDPVAIASQFGVTTSTPIPTPTPTQTAQQQAVQQDPESVTNPPIIVSNATTSDVSTVPIPTTPPAADSAESDIAFPTDSVVPSSTNNEQLIVVVPTVPTDTPSPTGAGSAAESATLESAHSGGKVAVGHLVGGIVGGLSFIALIGCLWLYFMRRRRSRDTLLTPLWVQSEKGPPTAYYEIDNASVGPTSLGSKWKAKATSRYHGVVGGFTALSSKISHKPSPSVNLNRGTSQFLAPALTHSRTSSSISHPPTALTRRERARDWWDRLTADAVFNWALSRHTKPTSAEPPSHFTRSRSASPSARAPSQDLTQYLASKDREMRDADVAGLLPDHRRSISLPPPTRSREDFGNGSLGIDFSDTGNPFSDPLPGLASTPGRTLAPNPFADPSPAAALSRPQPSVGTTYVADVRRSRGQSFSTPRHPSVRASRERSRDRDTMLSSGTTNTRRGKGRSDPFDLERPELLRGVGPGARGSVLSDVEELPSSAGSS